MTLARDTQGTAIKISSYAELTKFESEIRRFDIIMDLIQMHVPEDLKVWDRIAGVRDAMFKLQQQLRGVEIEVFAAPWIEPEEEEEKEEENDEQQEDDD